MRPVKLRSPTNCQNGKDKQLISAWKELSIDKNLSLSWALKCSSEKLEIKTIRTP